MNKAKKETAPRTETRLSEQNRTNANRGICHNSILTNGLTNVKYDSEASLVKQKPQKSIRHIICGIGAAVVLLLTLGIVGGIEQGNVSLSLGAPLCCGGVALFGVLLLFSGALRG